MTTTYEPAESSLATESATSVLSRFAAGLTFDAIPESVIESAKTLVLDCVGCTLYAAQLPWSRIMQRFVAAEASRESATVWGTAIRTSPSLAALANGTAGHGFEIDDVDHRAGLHAGSVTVPVVLGLAELRTNISGQEFLAALVAGLEVGLRVGVAVQPGHFLRGYHPQGTVGPIAAAGAASRTLGLDPARTAQALGIAGSAAGGLMGAQQGGMVKRLHAGRAGESGVLAAQLAQLGFTGTDDVFDIEFGGYLSTLQGTPGAIERLSEQMPRVGEEWLTPNLGYKIHASCAANHSTLDVVHDLRERHGLTAADVESVHVTTSHHTFVHCGWPYVPGDVVNAQMSLRYGVAAMLASGSAFVDQFTEERVADPALVELANRVEVEADETIDGRGSDHRHTVTVQIATRSGSLLDGGAEHRRGSFFNPVGRAEIVAKFAELTGTLEIDAAAIQEKILQLEHESDVSALATLLFVPGVGGT